MEEDEEEEEGRSRLKKETKLGIALLPLEVHETLVGRSPAITSVYTSLSPASDRRAAPPQIRHQEASEYPTVYSSAPARQETSAGRSWQQTGQVFFTESHGSMHSEWYR